MRAGVAPPWRLCDSWNLSQMAQLGGPRYSVWHDEWTRGGPRGYKGTPHCVPPAASQNMPAKVWADMYAVAGGGHNAHLEHGSQGVAGPSQLLCYDHVEGTVSFCSARRISHVAFCMSSCGVR